MRRLALIFGRSQTSGNTPSLWELPHVLFVVHGGTGGALHTARSRLSRRLEGSLDLSPPLETDSDILGLDNPSVIPSKVCGHLGCGVLWEPGIGG